MYRDISNQKFGYLTAKTYLGGLGMGRGAIWRCLCDCGQEVDVYGFRLLSGHRRSCNKGGHRYNRDETHIRGATTFYKSEYLSWQGAINRCYSERNPVYKHYGARGIEVCERWRSFKNFFEDMGPKPQSNYTIERIDVNGNYEPSNCRWATKQEQRKNMRTSVYVERNGEKALLVDLPKNEKVSKALLYARVKNCGWSVDLATTTPPRPYKAIIKKKVPIEAKEKVDPARCPDCGGLYALIGLRHRCIAKKVSRGTEG